MANRIRVVPYKQASNSGAIIAEGLTSRLNKRVLRVSPDSPTFRSREDDIYVNWGRSSPPRWAINPNTIILNHWDAVATAANKIHTFNALIANEETQNYVPAYTTIKDIALMWCRTRNIIVVGRTTLNGHSGQGIVLFNSAQEIMDYRGDPILLYVKYIKKLHEFRIHVGSTYNDNGELVYDVFDAQEKRRAQGLENRTDFQARVRSHANGWNFCRENLDQMLVARASSLAIDVIKTLNLDFGAVDIIYNSREDAFYILEVNTAVGLEGETRDNYTNMLTNLVRSI